MIISYDQLSINGQAIFGRRIDDAPVTACPQVLAEAYFLYIMKGACIIYSDEASLHLKQGQSVVMKGGMYVGHLFSDREAKVFEAISVRFDQKLLKYTLRDHLLELSKGTGLSSDPTMQQLDNSELISNYMQGMVYYFEHQQLATADILKLKLKEMILLLLQSQNASKIRDILKSPLMNRTYNFIRVVNAHIYSDLGIKELAHLTHMSMSSFKRQFKKEFNDSPVNYFQNKRLERAKYLLENSDHSITDIAYKCAFKTVSHFSKKFKEKYYQSPTEVRLSPAEQ